MSIGRRWQGLRAPVGRQRVTAQRARQMWQRTAIPVAPGLPIGSDQKTGAPVGGDPVTWARAGLLPRKRVVVSGDGDPLVQRWVLGASAFGVRPVVLGGGGRLVDSVAALGGQILEVGRGADSLNVLEQPNHRLAVTTSLLFAATSVMPTMREQRLLSSTIDGLTTQWNQPQAPVLWDLIAALQKRPGSDGLVQTLQSVVHHYGDVIARPSTARVDLAAPAVSMSVTGVNPKDTFLRAALHVAMWSAAAEYTVAHESLTVVRPAVVMHAMPGMLDELVAVLSSSVAVTMQVSAGVDAAATGCSAQVRADSGDYEILLPGRVTRAHLVQTSTEADIAAGLVSAPQPSMWLPDPIIVSDEPADVAVFDWFTHSEASEAEVDSADPRNPDPVQPDEEADFAWLDAEWTLFDAPLSAATATDERPAAEPVAEMTTDGSLLVPLFEEPARGETEQSSGEPPAARLAGLDTDDRLDDQPEVHKDGTTTACEVATTGVEPGAAVASLGQPAAFEDEQPVDLTEVWTEPPVAAVVEPGESVTDVEPTRRLGLPTPDMQAEAALALDVAEGDPTTRLVDEPLPDGYDGSAVPDTGARVHALSLDIECEAGADPLDPEPTPTTLAPEPLPATDDEPPASEAQALAASTLEAATSLGVFTDDVEPEAAVPSHDEVDRTNVVGEPQPTSHDRPALAEVGETDAPMAADDAAAEGVAEVTADTAFAAAVTSFARDQDRAMNASDEVAPNVHGEPSATKRAHVVDAITPDTQPEEHADRIATAIEDEPLPQGHEEPPDASAVAGGNGDGPIALLAQDSTGERPEEADFDPNLVSASGPAAVEAPAIGTEESSQRQGADEPATDQAAPEAAPVDSAPWTTAASPVDEPAIVDMAQPTDSAEFPPRDASTLKTSEPDAQIDDPEGPSGVLDGEDPPAPDLTDSVLEKARPEASDLIIGPDLPVDAHAAVATGLDRSTRASHRDELTTGVDFMAGPQDQEQARPDDEDLPSNGYFAPHVQRGQGVEGPVDQDHGSVAYLAPTESLRTLPGAGDETPEQIISSEPDGSDMTTCVTQFDPPGVDDTTETNTPGGFSDDRQTLPVSDGGADGVQASGESWENPDSPLVTVTTPQLRVHHETPTVQKVAEADKVPSQEPEAAASSPSAEGGDVPSVRILPAEPLPASRRPIIALGAVAAAIVAVAAVWAQVGDGAPTPSVGIPYSGGQAQAGARAPVNPGADIVPGELPPTDSGGTLDAQRNAPPVQAGAGLIAAGAMPPASPGAVVIAASTAARPMPHLGVANVSWSQAATWQKAQEPVVTQLPVAPPNTTGTVPQYPQATSPQVAPAQSGQGPGTGTGSASSGNGGGAQPAPGAPPPNQPFNPQNPDSPS